MVDYFKEIGEGIIGWENICLLLVNIECLSYYLLVIIYYPLSITYYL